MFRFFRETSRTREYLFKVATLDEADRRLAEEVDKARKELVGTCWESGILRDAKITDKSFKDDDGSTIYCKEARYWEHPSGNYSQIYFTGREDRN